MKVYLEVIEELNEFVATIRFNTSNTCTNFVSLRKAEEYYHLKGEEQTDSSIKSEFETVEKVLKTAGIEKAELLKFFYYDKHLHLKLKFLNRKSMINAIKQLM